MGQDWSGAKRSLAGTDPQFPCPVPAGQGLAREGSPLSFLPGGFKVDRS